MEKIEVLGIAGTTISCMDIDNQDLIKLIHHIETYKIDEIGMNIRQLTRKILSYNSVKLMSAYYNFDYNMDTAVFALYQIAKLNGAINNAIYNYEKLYDELVTVYESCKNQESDFYHKMNGHITTIEIILDNILSSLNYTVTTLGITNSRDNLDIIRENACELLAPLK